MVLCGQWEVEAEPRSDYKSNKCQKGSRYFVSFSEHRILWQTKKTESWTEEGCGTRYLKKAKPVMRQSPSSKTIFLILTVSAALINHSGEHSHRYGCV